MSLLRALLVTLALMAGPLRAEPAVQLVMVEEEGCMWCARWNEAIAPIYPKTIAGQAAPLRRMDIRAAHPDDLTFARALSFTPTFVLMIDGQESGRIEGYPGEDFFWGFLEQMLVSRDVVSEDAFE